MITGNTDSKLSKVATYDLNDPYKVGVNGVTDVIESTEGEENLTVKYSINGIDYETTFTLKERDNSGNFKKTNVFLGRLKNISDDNRPIPLERVPKNRGGILGFKGGSNSTPTTFKSYLSGFDFDDYPSIKDENKMGQVFPPEIKDEIFIERTFSNVFEKHSRLEDINNIGELENYKNGFFNVVKR